MVEEKSEYYVNERKFTFNYYNQAGNLMKFDF